MDRIVIPWQTGDGNIIVSESGGEVLISSDTINNGEERSQTLTFRTLTGNATATLLVVQEGSVIILRDSNGLVLRDSFDNILTAKSD